MVIKTRFLTETPIELADFLFMKSFWCPPSMCQILQMGVSWVDFLVQGRGWGCAVLTRPNTIGTDHHFIYHNYGRWSNATETNTRFLWAPIFETDFNFPFSTLDFLADDSWQMARRYKWFFLSDNLINSLLNIDCKRNICINDINDLDVSTWIHVQVSTQVWAIKEILNRIETPSNRCIEARFR